MSVSDVSTLLFTVVEPFFLSTGQLHVVSDTTEVPKKLRDGGLVELRRPDGSCVPAKCWTVRATSDPNYTLGNPNFRPPVSFYLEGLKKEDAPPNTQVWSVD